MNGEKTYYPNETHEHAGRFIQIKYDDVDFNPRKDWDHAATMVCVDSRYDLGDGKLELLYKALREDPMWLYCHEDPESKKFVDPDDVEAMCYLASEFGFEILPLYRYEHGGISMSTTGFSCPWDSGQVGIIFMSKKDMRDCYLVKRTTGDVREKARQLMVNEVTEYDQYLSGECYGFAIYKDKNCEIEIDSCWGFLGDLAYVSEEARQAAESNQSE